MDTEDKQPRVLKPAPSQLRKKRLLRYSLYMVIMVAVVIGLVIVGGKLKAHAKVSRSNKLKANITHLAYSSHCSEGMKQLDSIAPTLATNTQYTVQAREAALNYLMNCNFMGGNVSQGLVYSGQLKKLYAQDGNTQKQQQLTQLLNY